MPDRGRNASFDSAPRDLRRSLLCDRAVLLFVTAAMMTALPTAQQPLTLVGSIDLPRVEGRIDHLGYDSARQRLFVAALGNNTVEVLDLRAGRHLKSLLGFRELQGIAVTADAGLVAVANG